MKRKRKFAAALGYKHGTDEAPVVKAKGHGTIADNIERTALQHETPVQKDESLAEMLSQLHMNKPIPAELYEAVAEVFAFIYQVEREMKENRDNGGR